MEAAQGRGVRVFFGQDKVVQRLVNLPDEEQLQPQPQLGSRSRYIQKEVAVLSRTSTPGARTPEAASLEIGDGRLVMQHVDVVNVYVTTGPEAGASLLGVPGSSRLGPTGRDGKTRSGVASGADLSCRKRSRYKTSTAACCPVSATAGSRRTSSPGRSRLEPLGGGAAETASSRKVDGIWQPKPTMFATAA